MVRPLGARAGARYLPPTHTQNKPFQLAVANGCCIYNKCGRGCEPLFFPLSHSYSRINVETLQAEWQATHRPCSACTKRRSSSQGLFLCLLVSDLNGGRCCTVGTGRSTSTCGDQWPLTSASALRCVRIARHASVLLKALLSRQTAVCPTPSSWASSSTRPRPSCTRSDTPTPTRVLTGVLVYSSTNPKTNSRDGCRGVQVGA